MAVEATRDGRWVRKVKDRWGKSTIGRSAHVLSLSDQRKIAAVAILQIFMGFLDLLGVLAIGLLGALSVTGLQSQNPSYWLTLD